MCWRLLLPHVPWHKGIQAQYGFRLTTWLSFFHSLSLSLIEESVYFHLTLSFSPAPFDHSTFAHGSLEPATSDLGSFFLFFFSLVACACRVLEHKQLCIYMTWCGLCYFAERIASSTVWTLKGVLVASLNRSKKGEKERKETERIKNRLSECVSEWDGALKVSRSYE